MGREGREEAREDAATVLPPVQGEVRPGIRVPLSYLGREIRWVGEDPLEAPQTPREVGADQPDPNAFLPGGETRGPEGMGVEVGGGDRAGPRPGGGDRHRSRSRPDLQHAEPPTPSCHLAEEVGVLPSGIHRERLNGPEVPDACATKDLSEQGDALITAWRLNASSSLLSSRCPETSRPL